MSFAPYIGFSGDARPTMIAYAAIFGANRSANHDLCRPAHRISVRPGSDGLVMHAQFSIGPGAPLMGCDIPPGIGSGGMGGSLGVPRRCNRAARPEGLCGPVRRRHSHPAHGTHLLVARLWHGDRPIWHALDHRRRNTRRRGHDMIDHMGIRTTHPTEARRFYDAVFAALGGSMCHQVSPEHTGGRAVLGYGRNDMPQFWLNEGDTSSEAQHVAFTARDRAEVDALLLCCHGGRRARQWQAGAAAPVSFQLLRRLRSGPRWQQYRGSLPPPAPVTLIFRRTPCKPALDLQGWAGT